MTSSPHQVQSTGNVQRRAFVFGGGTVLVMAVGSTAEAAKLPAGLSVEANLDSDQARIGEQLVLEVEVTSQDDRLDPGVPEVRGPKGVEIVTGQTSQSMMRSFQNGRVTAQVTKTYVFGIRPEKAGTFEVAVRLPVGGRSYAIPGQLSFTASKDGALAVGGQQASGADKGDRRTGDVFLDAGFDKKSVYVGEQVTYHFDVWERTSDNLSLSEGPSFKSFWSEELPQRRMTRRRHNGVEYRVRSVARRALFPHTAGQVAVEGGEITVTPDSFGMIFNFGRRKRQRRRAYSLAAPKTVLEVKPLPAKGQPTGFKANNVGSYRISANIDKTKLEVGQALSLEIDIMGAGNLRLVEPEPFPDIPGFRRYEPKAETPNIDIERGVVQGRRRYSILLIAEQPGKWVIPSHRLNYFDPKFGEYRVAATEPIKVYIEGQAAAVPPVPPSPGAPTTTGQAGENNDTLNARSTGAPAAQLPEQKAEDDPLARPLTGSPLDRVKVERSGFSFSGWLGGMLAAPAVLGTSLLGLRLREMWAPSDAAQARRLRLEANETLMANAKDSREGPKAFAAAVAELLQANAIYAAGEQGVGLARERLLEALRKRGLAHELVDDLQRLANACDGVRFGAASTELDDRTKVLERCAKITEALVELHGGAK